MRDPISHGEPVFFEDTPFETTPIAGEDAASRPGNLTCICVLAIVLGVGGLFTGFSGLMAQVFAPEIQRVFAGMPGGANQPAADMQKELNAKLSAIGDRYKWVIIPLIGVKIIVESVLLAAAIMSLKLMPRGRSWLLGALVAAIVFEFIYVVPTILINRETQAVMSEMTPRMLGAQQGANGLPPGAKAIFSIVLSVITTATIVFAVVWLTTKVVFFVFGIRYLRKPEVVALFAPPADATAEAAWRRSVAPFRLPTGRRYDIIKGFSASNRQFLGSPMTRIVLPVRARNADLLRRIASRGLFPHRAWQYEGCESRFHGARSSASRYAVCRLSNPRRRRRKCRNG